MASLLKGMLSAMVVLLISGFTCFSHTEASFDPKTVTAMRLANYHTGWIGGEGWIARTDDAGESWKKQYQVDGTVNQLFALNDQDAWATAAKSSTDAKELLLYRTSDGGSRWSLVGKVPKHEFLHFISKQEGFGGNWHTTDGGKSWKPLPTPKNMLGDAYFHDRLNGWAVTKEHDALQVMRTQNGGKTWRAVMTRKTITLNGALIRSAGTDDAWIECFGDSGMTQTSYSLFHSANGGKTWQVVIAKATAGGGPAPGFPMNDFSGPTISGSSPGPLYVVNSQVAFMGGRCVACDRPNTIGWTVNGGKTVESGSQSFPGYGEMLIGFADATSGWLICNDDTEPSSMYTTTDGGKHWKKIW